MKPEMRYFGNEEDILSLETMKNMYALVAHNLKNSLKEEGTYKFKIS